MFEALDAIPHTYCNVQGAERPEANILYRFQTSGVLSIRPSTQEPSQEQIMMTKMNI